MKASGRLMPEPDRWRIGIAVDQAISELIATDRAYAGHGKAAELVAGLADAFDVPMSLSWGIPAADGNAVLPDKIGRAHV